MSRRPSAAEIAADLHEISQAHDLDMAEATMTQKLGRTFTIKLPKMHVHMSDVSSAARNALHWRSPHHGPIEEDEAAEVPAEELEAAAAPRDPTLPAGWNETEPGVWEHEDGRVSRLHPKDLLTPRAYDQYVGAMAGNLPRRQTVLTSMLHNAEKPPPLPPKPPPKRKPKAPAPMRPPSNEWYYLAASAEQEQIGPLTAAGMARLFGAGGIDTSTFVWCEGMEAWVELGESTLMPHVRAQLDLELKSARSSIQLLHAESSRLGTPRRGSTQQTPRLSAVPYADAAGQTALPLWRGSTTSSGYSERASSTDSNSRRESSIGKGLSPSARMAALQMASVREEPEPLPAAEAAQRLSTAVAMQQASRRLSTLAKVEQASRRGSTVGAAAAAAGLMHRSSSEVKSEMVRVLVELSELRINETFRELALSMPDYADAIEAIGQRAIAATHEVLKAPSSLSSPR